MKALVIILVTVLFLFACICIISCNSTSPGKPNNIGDSIDSGIVKKNPSLLLCRDSILKIAERNAKTAYRDLSIYTVKAELKGEKWYVDYEIRNTQMLGGGPHYIISARTGKIDSCRYEQ
jgi:hypothetical protein